MFQKSGVQFDRRTELSLSLSLSLTSKLIKSPNCFFLNQVLPFFAVVGTFMLASLATVVSFINVVLLILFHHMLPNVKKTNNF